MKHTYFGLITIVAILLSSGCAHLHQTGGYEPIQTGWMDQAAFKAMLAKFDQKDDQGLTFWEWGHWIDTVDGRWKDGHAEYRMSYSKVPPNKGYWWIKSYDLSKTDFKQRNQQLTYDGFALVYKQSYHCPGKGRRYQGVWHKTFK